MLQPGANAMNVRNLLFLAVLAPALAAQAQNSVNQNDAADPTDPPNRVARVSLLQGNVSLEPAGVNQFAAAEINYPLTAGDRIYADNQALTELQTSGLALRLGNGADLTVTTLTDYTAQFGLAQGSLRLRTRDLDAPPAGNYPDGQQQQAIVEIDTANGAILIERPGDIRVDSYPQDDTTVITVTSGQVEVTSNGVDQVLYANQALRLSGNPTYAEAVQPLSPDSLDRFDYERERARQQSLAISAQYVDADMIGAGDLGQYGDWDPNAAGPDADTYGAVWFPRAVPANWTPYSNGHWAWVVPWGWTWVEAEPWGFAPFHYGRWAQFGGRWGWIPGPPPSVFASGGRPFHPVYSPALVAFVGGPSFSISLGFGGSSGGGVTAWFPLGPREAYVPWYHASPGYVNRVNVTNIYNRNVTEVHNTYINRTTVVYNTRGNNTQVNNTYVNRNQATVAVPQHDFAAGRSVAQSQPIRFNPAQRQALTSAPVLPHPLVTPAAAIAAPQSPPRVVPPSAARPVLENRAGAGAGFNRGNAPANIRPVNPGGTPQTITGQPTQNQPAQGQFRPVPNQPNPNAAPRPGNANPLVDRRPGAFTPALPTSGSLTPAQQPASVSRPAQPVQPAPVTRPVPALGTQPAPGRQPQQPQPNYPSQTTRGSFPVQRTPQPAPAPPAAAPSRPTPAQGLQPTATQPTATLQARPLPRPVDQPRVLVNRAEPAPQPPSFTQQQRAIQRTDPGRPLGPQQLDNVRNNRPAGPAIQPEPTAHPAPPGRPAPAAKPAAPTPPAPGKPAPKVP